MQHRDEQLPFDRHLVEELADVQERADKLPPGPEKDELLRKVRQLELVAHINDWLASPGLRPPT